MLSGFGNGITTGCSVPIKEYLFKDLKQKFSPDRLELKAASSHSRTTSSAKQVGLRSPATSWPSWLKPGIPDVDMSAFRADDGLNAQPRTRSDLLKHDSTTSHFGTAPTPRPEWHSDY